MKKRFMALLLAFMLCMGTMITANAVSIDGDYGAGNGGSSESEQKPEQPEQKPEPKPTPTPDPTPSRGDESNDDSNYDRRPGSGSSSSSSDSDKKTEQTEETEPVEQPNTSQTAPVFDDVPSREWYYQAVTYVSTNGIMSGNGSSFAPNEQLTRGMMAQILYNLEKAADISTAVAFPDVSSSDWFATAASWASAKGFMSGYSNGSFGPNDAITREQLAAILYRYAQAKGYDVSSLAEISTFTDGASTSDWAETAVRWAVASGLLSGKTGVGGSRLDPTGTATRAEVAQILTNFATKIAVHYTQNSQTAETE